MINDIFQSVCMCIFVIPISLLNVLAVSFAIKLILVRFGFPISSWMRSALVTLCMIIGSLAFSAIFLLMQTIILHKSFFFFESKTPTEVWFSPVCIVGFMLMQSLIELPVAYIMNQSLSKKRIYLVLCGANFLVGIVGWFVFAGYL